jgi:plastocyanin domain-containing protein
LRTLVISLLLFAASSCTKDPSAQADGRRVIVMSVTEKGFEPSKISLAKGKAVRFVVTRTTESTCATELLVDGTDINVPLPLNTPTPIDFTPTKSGEVTFGCAMGMMVSGVLLVE